MSDRDLQPVDHEAREAARRDLARSWSVEAGAGTGKTTLLVDRVLEQLRSGAPIENVAAITFTVPAAAELAVRLREEILRRCREAASPAEAALWRRAEAGLDAAVISTIHSFCASLLRRFPAEAGVDPRFRSGDDDSAVSPIFERALEKWRGEVFSVPSGVPESVPLERALAVGITVPRMETALAALRSSPELVASLAVGAAEVPFPAAVVREFRDRIAFLEKSLGEALDREDKLADGLRRALEEAGPLLALDDESLALALVDDEEPLPVSLQGGAAAKWRGGKAQVDQLKGEIKQLRKKSDSPDAWRKRFDAEAGEWILAPLRRPLARFFEIYAEEKRRAGRLDFGDLLEKARALVATSAEARREASRGLDSLLVDEFQDTDPVQVELVSRLAGLGPPDEHRPGSIFLVGDPKQSIYRFRRADIESYQEARRRLLALGDDAAREALLVANFRSDPAILDFVNGLFRPIFEAGSSGSGSARQAEWRDLSPGPGRERRGGAVELLVPGEGWSDRPASVKRDREIEASAVAARIAGQLGRLTIRDRSGEARPLRAGDVALLFRALSDVGIYEDALRAAGIPSRIEGGKSFYRRQEIAAVIHALRAVESPDAELSVFAALRSPLFSIPHARLLAARQRLPRFDPTSPELDARLPPGEMVGDALRALRELRIQRNRRPLATTLDDLFDRTGIREALLARRDGERAAGNLEALVEVARGLSAAGPASFGDLVETLRRNLEEETEESEATTGDTGEGRVQLMSIHKSKGLEFPWVFLVDLGRQGRNESRPVVAGRSPSGERRTELALTPCRTRGFDDAIEAEALAAASERARLFYVAATRARERLTLSLLTAPAAGSLLELVEEAGLLPQLLGTEPLPFLPDADLHRIAVAPADPLPAADSGPTSPDAPPDAVDRLVAGFESARARRRAASGGAAAAPPSGSEDLPSTERPPSGEGGRGFGILVHRALERLPVGTAPFDPRVERLAAEIAGEEGVPGEAHRLSAHVRRGLSSDAWKRASASPQLLRELGFCRRLADGALQDGQIDLAFFENDGLVVVDWKSDAGGWAGMPPERRGHYEEQVREYAEALEELVPGTPVRERILVFTATGEEILVPPR